jgi:hypothetical protein
LGRVRLWAEAAWGAVTGFDAQRRERAIDAVAAALRHPALVLAVLVVLAWWWRRRRAATPAAVMAYRRTLRRLRLRLEGGETPRQLLARCRTVLSQDALGRLCAATERHERLRYRRE